MAFACTLTQAVEIERGDVGEREERFASLLHDAAGTQHITEEGVQALNGEGSERGRIATFTDGRE